MQVESNQSHWIPLADLMTGLMMIFLLITAAFMLRVEQTTTLVVKEFEVTKKILEKELKEEFEKDLKKWNAEWVGDMTIEFRDPDVLFATGESKLSAKYKEVLQDFFPRYIRLLTNEKFRSVVKEVRIEGHTSARWSSSASSKAAYFKNMELSQARTRSTLEYLLSMPELESSDEWIIQKVTANGLSSSHADPADPNAKKNQRVEFKIITTSDERLGKISEKLIGSGK